VKSKEKVKVGFLYSANYTVEPEQRALQSWKWQLIGKTQWCCGLSFARANGHWTRGGSQQAHYRPNQPHQSFTS